MVGFFAMTPRLKFSNRGGHPQCLQLNALIKPNKGCTPKLSFGMMFQDVVRTDWG